MPLSSLLRSHRVRLGLLVGLERPARIRRVRAHAHRAPVGDGGLDAVGHEHCAREEPTHGSTETGVSPGGPKTATRPSQTGTLPFTALDLLFAALLAAGLLGAGLGLRAHTRRAGAKRGGRAATPPASTTSGRRSRWSRS